MQTLLFIFGTRPEAVKMAPLIKECEKYPKDFNVKVAVTGQHREMLDQVLEFFKIKPDYDLKLMKPNQTLFDVTADALRGMEKILDEVKPDLIIVQGDTTTVFTGALAGFYKKIPIAHLEAGLRSGDKYSPFPEEINRILTGHIADYHWAPTEQAKKNLLNEGIKEEKIYVVQNTVIDALFLALELLKKEGDSKYEEFFKDIDFSKKVVLVTAHRRESFGEPFENICNAVKELSTKYPNVEFIYPVHLNPNVREVVYRILSNIPNVHLIEPLDYPYMVWIMNKSYMVLTDSGGVQEEAPSLGKPVLVLRDVTERQEGVDAGTAKLVGTDKELIIRETSKLLDDTKEYEKMAKAINPYGDGHTSERIVELIK
ncbi:MAG: UDP-N-acetylglucosamine 2-epimerase [candidate division WS6 bacterium 34_10]|uniref:UDP-N-acetylglucosamine 2-epimerase (non-hydrolyzing) n=1 Tax=candidate division WS6 bacterium 34_10 TaxID=1641389 RepID=A0A101HHG5_9BACT|nr:MAG: UDP-N-acetylglucosamine 2-epimerase [candidate division WS6 bacterium 34_10]